MHVEVDELIGETTLTPRDVTKIGQYFLGMVTAMQTMGHNDPAASTIYTEPNPNDPLSGFVVDVFRCCLTGTDAREAEARVVEFILDSGWVAHVIDRIDYSVPA